MSEDLGERTEEATPRRLQEAREEGNVARSSDFAAAIVLAGVVVILWAGLMPASMRMAAALRRGIEDIPHGLTAAPAEQAEQAGMWALLTGAQIALPLLLGAWLVAYASNFVQVGWLFVPKSLQPKAGKINPLSGLRRVFGVQALVKAALDSSKVLIVFIVVAISVSGMRERILLLPNLDIQPALGVVGWMLFDLAVRIVAVLLILGVIDLSWQKWKHRRDLRMSRTEIRDEMKQTEGDPETRKRRMRMQQQIAMQRLRSSVPRADVIVTNPEHISIAIQYDQATMSAPKVVAKGADYIALRIRQIAMEHRIPIVERKPLARALYRSVEVGREIPPDFYQAIAEILAYVYRMRKQTHNRTNA